MFENGERTPTVPHRTPSWWARAWDLARFLAGSKAGAKAAEAAGKAAVMLVGGWLLTTVNLHCSKDSFKREVKTEIAPDIAEQAQVQAHAQAQGAYKQLKVPTNAHAEEIEELRQQVTVLSGAILQLQGAQQTPSGAPAASVPRTPARRKQQRKASEAAVQTLKLIQDQVADAAPSAKAPETLAAPPPSAPVTPGVPPVSKPQPAPSVDAAQKGG